MPSLSEWAALVDNHLGFLRDRGYRLVPVADEPDLAAWGPRVQYLGTTMGLQVHWSVEFVCVDTFVIRLVDSQVPDYPIFIHDGDPIYWFHLSMLLDVLGPERDVADQSLEGLEPESVQRQLSFVADLLRDFADQLLNPTSQALSQVTTRLHESARADPPKITIHVPDDTSPEEVARTVEKSRSAFPRVGVLVRRYFTRRRPRS